MAFSVASVVRATTLTAAAASVTGAALVALALSYRTLGSDVRVAGFAWGGLAIGVLIGRLPFLRRRPGRTFGAALLFVGAWLAFLTMPMLEGGLGMFGEILWSLPYRAALLYAVLPASAAAGMGLLAMLPSRLPDAAGQLNALAVGSLLGVLCAFGAPMESCRMERLGEQLCGLASLIGVVCTLVPAILERGLHALESRPTENAPPAIGAVLLGSAAAGFCEISERAIALFVPRAPLQPPDSSAPAILLGLAIGVVCHSALSRKSVAEVFWPLWLAAAGVCAALLGTGLGTPHALSAVACACLSFGALSALERRPTTDVFLCVLSGLSLGALTTSATDGVPLTLRTLTLSWMFALATATAVLSSRLVPRSRLAGIGSAALLVTACAAVGFSPAPQKAFAGWTLPSVVRLRSSEDRLGLVELVEDRQRGTRSLLVNGTEVGATTAQGRLDGRLHAHFSALLHAAPRRALLVGLGSGTALEALLTHPIDSVDLLEPSPALLAMLRGGAFDADVSRALTDSRVRLLTADLHSHLRQSADSYDLILWDRSAESPGPSLFEKAADYLPLLSRCLAPGGILCRRSPQMTMGASADVQHFEIPSTATTMGSYSGHQSKFDVSARGISEENASIWRIRAMEPPAVTRSLRDVGIDFPDALLAMRYPTAQSDFSLAESALFREWPETPRESLALARTAKLYQPFRSVHDATGAFLAHLRAAEPGAPRVVDLLLGLSECESRAEFHDPELDRLLRSAIATVQLEPYPKSAHERVLDKLGEALTLEPASVRARWIGAYAHSRAGAPARALEELAACAERLGSESDWFFEFARRETERLAEAADRGGPASAEAHEFHRWVPDAALRAAPVKADGWRSHRSAFELDARERRWRRVRAAGHF
ncbi:MAG: hypothetical protein JNJ88_18350 [Planctomycetes bacterium]|nr:hypothetical protein [Planctomycetota bacterium]